ncbi:MAG TPA: alpha-amylase family glycosyl hydrolase [Streptosporangiaceae bacterium]|nr:alpha-amylase family glycosyl hydrolase [Streptosporangiaceae bacterium]
MTGERWWQGAVLYQVYVRSFSDSNGDGFGDLPGLTARLPYLDWLGIDGIWLSPTMPSPDRDWGYDVSDYLGVHQDFGTLADLDALIGEAARLGIKVLLDLVPNHTSSAHPWFVDAASDPASAHRDYYVWAAPRASGGPPNNWVDFTGSPAWAFDTASGQYYLHNYLPEQPDLNWWEPAVHREFREIIEFWFGRGVAGFRIDVAHGLYKDAKLRDDPPNPDPGPLTGRHAVRHVYSANRQETHEVYREWRSIAERYSPPRLLLGETWTGDFDALASYYGDDDELHLGFNIPFIFAAFSAPGLSDVVRSTLASLPAGACPVWTASNHDAGRFPARWCRDDPRLTRLALTLLMTLPGTTVLYYGDEIGMTDVAVPAALRRDPMSLDLPPDQNRDRCRTPMQWDTSAHGGFSPALAVPWLPPGDFAGCNVAGQREDPGSVLSYCRELIELRKDRIGADLGYTVLPAPEGVWCYAAGSVLVAANFGDHRADLRGFASGTVLLSSQGKAGGDLLSLAPGEAVVASRA